MNKRLFFLPVLMVFFNTAFAQNIHDLDHTKQFADYLFKTGQYEFAAEEYERIVFLEPENLQNKFKLIEAYRKAGNYKASLLRFDLFFKDRLADMPPDFADEYVKLLLLTRQDSLAYHYLNLNSSLNIELKQNYQLASLLLQKKWDDAFNYAMSYPVSNEKMNAQLHLLAFNAKRTKYKKPALAGFMSAIVPGTGKFYTKNWKDGIIAMTFVGVNAWQAYRGFKKYGKQSAYGWIFAGMSFGFYIGNIYGSVKSAKKYNKKTDDDLYEKALDITLDNF